MTSKSEESNVDLWMPLFIGDYQKDTMRLSTVQHGAYLLMLMEYWVNGPLPDDDDDLASITKLSDGEWAKHKAKLSRFFVIRDGFWFNKRADEEIEAAKKRREASRRNGKKGGRPAKNQGKSETQKKPIGFNQVSKTPHFQNLEKSSSPSPSPSPISSTVPPPSSSSSQPSSLSQGEDVSTGCLGGGEVDETTGEIIRFAGGAR